MAVKDDYGYVYVINFGDDKSFKIGFTTTEPEERLKSIQRTSVVMPNTMSLVMSSLAHQPFYLEQILHSKFDTSKIKGEWFELSFPDLVDVYKILYTVGGDGELHPNWFSLVPNDYQLYIDNSAVTLEFTELFFNKKDLEKHKKENDEAFDHIKKIMEEK